MSPMPKHGWKWRTESLKSLGVSKTLELLRTSRITPKLARWIYLRYAEGPYDWTSSYDNAPEELFVIMPALDKLDDFNVARTGSNPGWIKPFMWRELYRHKGDLLGEHIAESGYIFAHDDEEAAGRLMDLYEDESAHPFTRGNVLYALISAPIPDHLLERFQQIVRHGLSNAENAYARCTACMLAVHDPTIQLKDIEPLLSDQAGLKTGWVPTVSQYAQDAYDCVQCR